MKVVEKVVMADLLSIGALWQLEQCPETSHRLNLLRRTVKGYLAKL